MSDIIQEDRLRLVPLVATLTEIEKPQLDLSEVFDLAIKGEIRLYSRVPPDKVVYVDNFLPIVSHRRSGVFMPDLGDFIRYNPRSSQFHPEITHVALDPDHAGELKAATRLTKDMAFASGLLQHPDHALAQNGWLVPCQFGSSLVLCPAPPETEVERNRQRVRRIFLTTTPDDIYVDERVVALLADPEGTLDSDPYSLFRRAPGVYALFLVATRYGAAMKEDKTKFAEAQKLIISVLSELGGTKAKLIAKQINPHHRRTVGIPKDEQKHFDLNLLSDKQFKSRYKKVNFVTDALALILYVTEKWLDSRAGHWTGATVTHADRTTVDVLLDEHGFYKNERNALTELLLLRHVISRNQTWRKITSTNDVP